LRPTSNEGTLRAFRNADRFPTFKIFRSRALFDDVSLQVNRGDRVGLVATDHADSHRLKSPPLLDLLIPAREGLCMSPRLQQIEAEALRLPPEERESLAGVLVQSLEDASVNEIDAAWIEEAEQRFQKWQAGKTDGIPSAKFFSEIRRDLGWR
jgi:putative addiction module component (TIGR02574 family)